MTRQPDGRRYRLMWTRLAVLFLTVGWLVIWLIWVLASHRTNWPIASAVGVCLVAVSLWGNVLAEAAGVIEDDQGIVSRSLFSTRRYEWTQIACFEHNRFGTHDYVYARLADGSRHRLTNVLQGQRVVWNDGQTSDIVTLNERLATRRGAPAKHDHYGARANP